LSGSWGQKKLNTHAKAGSSGQDQQDRAHQDADHTFDFAALPDAAG
jgi:hypothetical protein